MRDNGAVMNWPPILAVLIPAVLIPAVLILAMGMMLALAGCADSGAGGDEDIGLVEVYTIGGTVTGLAGVSMITTWIAPPPP